MKKIRKVIIPAAGWGTRFLPLTKVVHKELVPVLNKPIIHYLAEEAVKAGIEEVVLIISSRKLEILKYFTPNSALENELKQKGKVELLQTVLKTNDLIKVTIAIQNEQLGLGHAILMGHDQTQDEPFAVILGDDLINAKIPAIKQLVDAYNQTGASIIGVQPVSNDKIHQYGVVQPVKPYDPQAKLFEIQAAVEKPQAADAPSNQAIMGRYVFTAEIMPLLRTLKPGKGNEINVVDALPGLIELGQKVFALEFEGQRYDLGSIEGFVKAQIDYALVDPKIKDAIKEHLKSKLK